MTDSTGGRDKDGRFATGNRLWEVRSSAGPKPIFANPDDLWTACVEYFEWVDDNPLVESKLFSFQGSLVPGSVDKMRAMTIGGMCVFLGVTHKQWIEWRVNRSDLSEVIAKVEAIIYEQKFTGASADLLNANIIARDLGLADKNEHTSPDGSMSQKSAIDVSKLSTEALAEIAAAFDASSKSD